MYGAVSGLVKYFLPLFNPYKIIDMGGDLVSEFLSMSIIDKNPEGYDTAYKCLGELCSDVGRCSKKSDETRRLIEGLISVINGPE